MSEFSKTSTMLKRPMHPRVIKVLARISCLSPSIMPRDTHQPKQGCLNQMKKQQSSFTYEEVIQTPKKPSTTLNLSSSLFNRRKLSMSAN